MTKTLKVIGGRNYNNNESNNVRNRRQTQGNGNRPSVVYTYGHCGLKGHKEEDCRQKADDLHNIGFKESMEKMSIVETVATDCLKTLVFTPGLEMYNSKTNTELFLQSKMGDKVELTQLHTLFSSMFDRSERKDNSLSQLLFNIIPEKCSVVFTLKEHQELVKMFKLKEDETIEFDHMSEFEDDVDIISCPLATPRSKPLWKG